MVEKSSATPRWREIVLNIETAIQSGELKPGMALPPEAQISLDYSVSRMTAHRAMTELQYRGLVVRKRRVGTVVATPSRPRTNHVAVLCFAISDFPTAAYIAGLRAGLSDDYGLLLCDTCEDATKEARFLERMEQEADAVVCLPCAAHQNNALLNGLAEKGIPLLCLDRVPEGLGVNGIITDNYGSTLQALRLLTARGHRRIAHFTDSLPHVSSTHERLLAHQDALREVGVENPDQWVRFFTGFSLSRQLYYPQMVREVHDALLAMMLQKEAPTAIFCLRDAYMVAVLEACKQWKFEVPSQLEIVTFNDCPPQFLMPSSPVLRIVQHPHQMGMLAAQRITQALQKGSTAPQVTRVKADIFDPLASA